MQVPKPSMICCWPLAESSMVIVAAWIHEPATDNIAARSVAWTFTPFIVAPVKLVARKKGNTAF